MTTTQQAVEVPPIRPLIEENLARERKHLFVLRELGQALANQHGKTINARFERIIRAAFERAGHPRARIYYTPPDTYRGPRVHIWADSQGPNADPELPPHDAGDIKLAERKGDRYSADTLANGYTICKRRIQELEAWLAGGAAEGLEAKAADYLAARQRLREATEDVPFAYAWLELVRKAERYL